MADFVKPVEKMPSEDKAPVAAPVEAAPVQASPSQGVASTQSSAAKLDERPSVGQRTSSESVAPAKTGSLPGIMVNPDKFVVLASRLGRGMEKLPMIDPNNEKEEQKYFVPEAFERGEQIERSQIAEVPGIDNVERLLKIGAIGRFDHPDAQPAMAALDYRRQQERRVGDERGIVITAHS